MKIVTIILAIFFLGSNLLVAELTLTEMRLLRYKPPMVLEPGDNPHTVGVEKLIEHIKTIQELEKMSDDEVVSLAERLIERAKNSDSGNEKILGSRAVHIYAYYEDYSGSAMNFIMDLFFNYPRLKMSARHAIGYFPVDVAIEAYLEIESKIDDPVDEVKIYSFLSRHTDAIQDHPRRNWIVSTLRNRFEEKSAPSSVRYLDVALSELDPDFVGSAERREKLQMTLSGLSERVPEGLRDYFHHQVARFHEGN